MYFKKLAVSRRVLAVFYSVCVAPASSQRVGYDFLGTPWQNRKLLRTRSENIAEAGSKCREFPFRFQKLSPESRVFPTFIHCSPLTLYITPLSPKLSKKIGRDAQTPKNAYLKAFFGVWAQVIPYLCTALSTPRSRSSAFGSAKQTKPNFTAGHGPTFLLFSWWQFSQLLVHFSRKRTGWKALKILKRFFCFHS